MASKRVAADIGVSAFHEKVDLCSHFVVQRKQNHPVSCRHEQADSASVRTGMPQVPGILTPPMNCEYKRN